MSPRLELFQPPAVLAPFLLQHAPASSFNLPNKAKGEAAALLERAGTLRAVLPLAPDICVHWAVSNNYARTPEATFAGLEAFAERLAAVPACSLLLVSGGGPRRKLDSLQALELLAASPRFHAAPLPLAVAFNPFFPDEARQQEERDRLRAKLAAGRGHVAAVYLQAGSDADRLEQGLVWLQQQLDELAGPRKEEQRPAPAFANTDEATAKQQQPPQQQQQQQRQVEQPELAGRAAARPAKRPRRQLEAAEAMAGTSTGSQRDAEASPAVNGHRQQPRGGRPAVIGSLLVPSRKLLAAMKFRPWGGVFLGEEWLSGVEAADGATRRILAVYARHAVVPLVETEVATPQALERVTQLLVLGDSGDGDVARKVVE
ncbi:Paired amphipathic helix repeat [Micractinium conductrix]|uniref:Paired amphipathic helix repeat n=1 Tax=Micractinium conductrix TaxID=554055 RepID=A0A2P6VF39_9CHLO|nr:Paired amphipathic helix repeat [Micractinium conductrix]|eukprot:PSC72691.1 Paired amphipathic helix repeat [Micractinium conductrix]